MIKYIIFQPDDHYGFPEISKISEDLIFPLDINTLINIYKVAPYSGYSMNSEYAQELDRDDYDSDEEYEEEEKERQEKADEEAEAIFSDYGYFDVYLNTYLISSHIENDNALDGTITGIIQNMMDGENTNISDELIATISREEGVDFIMSLGSSSKIAIKGELFNIGSMSGKDIMNIEGDVIKNIIIDRFKKGDIINSSKIFNVFSKMDSSIKNSIKLELSDEEYDILAGTGKGYGLLKRLGENIISINYNESHKYKKNNTLIKRFQKFNESTDFNPYVDQIKKINSEIDMLKKQIEKKETEIKKLESAYGDKEFSNDSTIIDELKRNGITQIYTSDENERDLIGSPFTRTNSADSSYFEFINPEGIRIGVTFAFETYGWNIFADVIIDQKRIIPIVSMEMSKARTKTFVNDILSVTNAWVRAKERKIQK